MPLMNSMGALKEQNMVTSVIGGNQYVVTVSNSQGYFFMPSDTGNAYFVTNNTMGITKVDSNGNVLYQKTATTGGSVNGLYVHSDNAVYVVGTYSNKPALVQYSSIGTVAWERTLNTASTGGSQSPITDSTGNVFVTIFDSGTSPNYSLIKYNAAGTLLAQKHILTSTTVPLAKGMDYVNQQLLVAGFDSSTSKTSIYNGIYPWSTTSSITPSNTILVQSSLSENYQPTGGLISDGTYIYQGVKREVSGIGHYAYAKIDQTTGAVVYSYKLLVNGTEVQVDYITQDTFGYMYLVGQPTSRAFGYVAKIRQSDGYIVWCKTITVSSFDNYQTFPITWRDRFVYFGTAWSPTVGSPFSGYFKLKDDGSLPDGTYASTYVIAKASTSTSALNSDSTSTITDSQSTVAYTTTSNTITTATSGYTMTTTLLP
jgi:hypothetical protein